MLNDHDRFDRRIRAMLREDSALDAKAYSIEKLDEPIQRGWKRSHFLIRDAERRHDRETLSEILRHIGNIQHHHDAKFLRRRGRGRRKRMVDIAQPLHEIPDRPWGKSVLPESWRSYFRPEQRLTYKGQPFVMWVFKYPHLFELRVEPNLYWYVRVSNSDVLSRQQEISSWLRWNHGRQRMANLEGTSCGRRWWQPRRSENFLIRELNRIAFRAMRGEVEPAASAWSSRFSLQRKIMSAKFSLS